MKLAKRSLLVLAANCWIATLALALLSLAACVGTGAGNTGGGGSTTTLPALPTGLSATAGNAQVVLDWSAGAGATSYIVKRGTAAGGPYMQIASPSAVTYTDTGLKNGTQYFYVVASANSAGDSANSSEVNATPELPIPSAPSGLVAMGGSAQVTLKWNTSSGATSYHVKRSTTSGSETQVAAPTSTAFTDTTAKNGTKYFYVVSAVNSAGESANSAEVSVTPSAPAQAPPVPTDLAATAGNAQVVLTWNASNGATSYHVKRSTTSGSETQIAAATMNSYTDATALNGTKYFYVISAVNSTGESANSNEVSATPTTPAQAPPTPTNLAATAGNAQVALTWSGSTSAKTYNVKRSTTNGGGYSTLSSPTATNYTDTSVTNETTYYYVVSAVNSTGESANSSQTSATPSAPAAANVTITVDPTKTHPISPYIYGINFFSGITGAPPQLTFDRDGGNRWTAYNWETNASNAGSDYLYENDDYLSSSTVPAEAVRSFIAGDQSNNLASLITVQLQGLVAGDENGPVSVADPPDMSRFKTVVDQKSSMSSVPFTLNPPTTDAYVYMDEFAWALDQTFSGMGIFGTSPTHPTFISLDNEPELWNSTHLEVQGPNPVTSDDYISKTIALSEALKDQFPEMKIFGPVHYGFQGIYNWQGELSSTPSGTNWFPDKYLTAISSASAAYGKPLVDVYDFHWYVEEYDPNGTRAIDLNETSLTDAQVQLIVQSPRALWDPTFTDSTNSNPWIYEELGNTPINILGRLQTKINSEFPGMRISITEYENGGWNHIAGTIAEADDLGIFGAQNLFAASFWPPNGTYAYAIGGFRAFRDFDGNGSNFGDTSLSAASSNVTNVVVYASTDSTTPGRTVFVAINRSTSSQTVAINGAMLSGTARIYQVTATSAAGQDPIVPISAGTQAASGSSLTVTLPALSVTTIDVH
ncbi:MAG: glycoside hydrolase family 44 protein [Candidatus Acidiferrales bacterium]